MPTIRDLIQALGARDGVDAVVVVGRDGLPIDAHAADGIDPESLAAVLPSVINRIQDLGSAGARGDFGMAVLEFGNGLAIVSVLSADALLIVLVRPSTNIGSLLFDLRRHRPAIAGLL